jgi:nucleoside-diphosphate-sugar epimerase
MRILVIGGTSFIGRFLLERLMRERHQIAVFHRGRHSSEKPSGIEQIVGDRNHLRECHHAFERLVPDIVIDMILSSGRQAKELMATFAGLTGRVVALSSMDVYRACAVMHGLEPGPIEPVPLTEDSPLRTKGQTYPPAQIKMLQQIFGWLDDEYDKIPVEREVLGHPTLPGTVLRLPMCTVLAIP